MPDTAVEFDAWNPGLSSQIPARLLPQATLFRSENAIVSHKEARDAASFCGLDAKDMATFRVERLVTHELLIRVTGDLSVPDGPSYEELGINLRNMTARIRAVYIEPKLDEIRAAFDEMRDRAEAELGEILDRDVFAPEAEPEPEGGFLKRLFGARKPAKPSAGPKESPEVEALADWQRRLAASHDGFEKACLSSLIAVVGGIVGNRGRLIAERAMIVRFALNILTNDYGSRLVGGMLDPIIRAAVETENYRFLPGQDKPFFMNVKGASAAGKSTIRPAQRKLAERLDVPWEDFALISPDYWRKFLIDYDSLGDDYKYAAMLTGQELEIIDKKLDRYMARKAKHNEMPHLLIDRFRFDSFRVNGDAAPSQKLLTRFGDTVFFFFIVTPPVETVERAWKRGNSTGRYKAVDDLLHHNVEAYTGMPNLFFSSVVSPTKKIHFEFLDNSVALGQPPRTTAYGWNNRMTILDLERLCDVDRFKDVNIRATRPEDVLAEGSGASFSFIKTCMRKIPVIVFADCQSGRIYGRLDNGKWTQKDASVLADKPADSVMMACLSALGWDDASDMAGETTTIEAGEDEAMTLGTWGGAPA